MSVNPDYHYGRSEAAHTHAYLMPVVEKVLASIGRDKSIFELGCGNGATAAHLTSKGYKIVGVDPSESGIAIAKESFPECRLELGSTDDDLAGQYGEFDVILSLEVVEHVYSPKRYVETIRALLKPGGVRLSARRITAI